VGRVHGSSFGTLIARLRVVLEHSEGEGGRGGLLAYQRRVTAVLQWADRRALVAVVSPRPHPGHIAVTSNAVGNRVQEAAVDELCDCAGQAVNATSLDSPGHSA
jgi:hypothetical protein